MKKFLNIIGHTLIWLAAIALFITIVILLWSWLMPDIY
jgi:hypothetical protein